LKVPLLPKIALLTVILVVSFEGGKGKQERKRTVQKVKTGRFWLVVSRFVPSRGFAHGIGMQLCNPVRYLPATMAEIR
jgi:hypothetical protein